MLGPLARDPRGVPGPHGLRVTRALVLVVAAGLACGCARPPAVHPPAAAAAAISPVALPASPTPVSGLGPKADRRRLRPAVIGGCGPACSTPEAAVTFWLLQFKSPDRVAAMRPLYEWSLLQVDGENLGDHWAQLWSDDSQHAQRQQEIDAWLVKWTAWTDRVVSEHGFAQMRSTGIQLRQVDADHAVVQLRHPLLRDDTTLPLWRLTWQRRGDEWLLAKIEHRPTAVAP